MVYEMENLAIKNLVVGGWVVGLIAILYFESLIGDTYRKLLEIREPKARSEQTPDLTSNYIIAGNGMCKVYFVFTFI